MAMAQSYVAASRRSPDVQDYVDIMRRYRAWILGPAFAGLVIATVVGFFWPDTYVSRAMLRITPQPTNIIPSEFGAQISQRLTDIENQTLSRTTLEGIIRSPELDLYKREQRVKPMEDIVTDMQRDIDVRIIGSPVIGGDGRPTASAFAISFRYPDRVKAQRVVSALVSRFVESNERARSEETRSTIAVVDEILKQDKAKVDDLERQIAQFDAAHQGQLPDEFQSNLQMLSDQRLEINQLTGQLQAARDAKTGLESELKGELAQQELAQSRLYKTKETAGPRAADAATGPLAGVLADIEKLDNEIAAGKTSMGENNPAMKAMAAQRAMLQQKKDALERDQEIRAAHAPAPNAVTAAVADPEVESALRSIDAKVDQIRTQIGLKDQEMGRLTGAVDDAKSKLQMYQARIDAGPAAGQEYARLKGERDLAQGQYEQDLKKKSVTDEVNTMERFQAGEKLVVLDSASLPEEPVEPKRPLYAAIGAAAGLLVGLMLAGAKEVQNTSLKNLKDVRAYTQMTVLSSVPLLENALLVRRKRRLYWLAWSSAVVAGFVAMGASMYYYYSQIH